MNKRKTYEDLELNVYTLDVADIVRTSPNDDGEWDWT